MMHTRLAPVLLAALLAASLPLLSGRAAPAPSAAALVLSRSELPGGYVADDALENADATARSAAYRAIVRSSAFAGYRSRDVAVVHYVALLSTRADAAVFLSREGTAVDKTHDAARITLSHRYGDAGTLGYQQRGTRGEMWVFAVFSDGPYVSVLGCYARAGEQHAIALVQALAAPLDAQLRRAARLALASTSGHTTHPTAPALRILALATTTRAGRASDTFHQHGTLYWRAAWRFGPLPSGARETVQAWIGQGKRIIYRNSLTDRPYTGDNTIADHVQPGAVPPGRYTLTITITSGHLSARATHAFRIAAARSGR